MKKDVLFVIFLSAATAAASWKVPGLAYRYAVWKSKKRGKALPQKSNRPWQNILCILFCGAFTAVTAIGEPRWKAVFAAAFVLTACFGILVDGMIRIIGNEMVAGLLGAGILYRILDGGPKALLSSLAAAGLVLLLFLAAAFLTKLLSGTGGVGMGDIKLAMVGAFIAGTENLMLFVYGMCLAMILFLLWKFRLRAITKSSAFPMCFPLMAGLLLSVSQRFFNFAQNAWSTILWG